MRLVEMEIARLQEQFAQHPVFDRLRAAPPWEALTPLVEGLTFWILSFHDILEVVEAAMEAPVFQEIARHHHQEEGGHDRWFLSDLRRLGIPLPDAPTLFGRRHAATRRAAVLLIAEAYRAQTDEERLSLILGLEATGAVFFSAAAAYPGWPTPHLRFFSDHHLQVEKGHQLFEEKMKAWVQGIALDPQARTQVLASVHRVFAAFHLMFDGFEAALSAATTPPITAAATAVGRPDTPSPQP